MATAGQKYNNPLGIELGQNGVKHIQSSDGVVTPPSDADRFFRLIPANGTTPKLATPNGGSGSTKTLIRDNFVDGQTVGSEGLDGPFESVELKQGEVYAYVG